MGQLTETVVLWTGIYDIAIQQNVLPNVTNTLQPEASNGYALPLSQQELSQALSSQTPRIRDRLCQSFYQLPCGYVLGVVSLYLFSSMSSLFGLLPFRTLSGSLAYFMANSFDAFEHSEGFRATIRLGGPVLTIPVQISASIEIVGSTSFISEESGQDGMLVCTQGNASEAAPSTSSLPSCITVTSEGLGVREELFLNDVKAIRAVSSDGPSGFLRFADSVASDVILSSTMLYGFGSNSEMSDGGTVGAESGTGGCIRVLTGSLQVNDSALVGCSAGRGGAVFLETSTVSVATTSFEDCSASENGGAMYLRSTTGVVSSAMVLNNRVVSTPATEQQPRKGGGFYCFSSSSLVIKDSVFRNNQVEASSRASGVSASDMLAHGGAFVASSSSVRIENTVYEGNMADLGGGLFIEDGTIQLLNSTLRVNIARQAGGGAYLASMRGGVIEGSVFVENTVLYGNGGGLAAIQPYQAIHVKETQFVQNR